jgi:hypothetical protein
VKRRCANPPESGRGNDRAPWGRTISAPAMACASSEPRRSKWRVVTSVAGSSCACKACVEDKPRVETCSLAAAERSRRLLWTRATDSFVGVQRRLRGRSVYAMSELPTNFGFFAASAGCRGMRARQDSTHFPSAAVWSPVRGTCNNRKKQDLLQTPFR